MRELALFAGAGGGILGGHLLGWRCVCAVEIDNYARRVLLARQRDGMLPHFPVWDDVTTFDGGPWRGRVDVVSGGFPCQDISAAGKGAGLGGSRSGLWSEFARIIGEVQPRYVFVENSPVLTSRGLGVVLGDLATLGYDARWGVMGACDVGAPHKRERIWIVADACGGRCGGAGEWQGEQPGRAEVECAGEALAYAANDGIGWGQQQSECREGAGYVADTESAGLEGHGPDTGESEITQFGDDGCAVSYAEDAEQVGRWNGPGWRCGCQGDDDGGGAKGIDWWLVEPAVGRVAHGVASRVDRLRCLGNGQVPAVAARAWRQLTMDN